MEPVRFRLWWLTRQQVKEIYDATFEEKIMLPPALEHEIYEAFEAEDEDYQEGKYFIPACCRIEPEQIEMETPPDDDANGIGIVYPVEWEKEIFGLAGVRRNLVITGDTVPFVDSTASYGIMHVNFSILESMSAMLNDYRVGVTPWFKHKIQSLASMKPEEFRRMQQFCSAVGGAEVNEFQLSQRPEAGDMGIVCLMSDYYALPSIIREQMDCYPAFYTGKTVELVSDSDYPISKGAVVVRSQEPMRDSTWLDWNKPYEFGYHCWVLNKKDVTAMCKGVKSGDYLFNEHVDAILDEQLAHYTGDMLISAVPDMPAEFFSVPEFLQDRNQIGIIFRDDMFVLDMSEAGVLLNTQCIKRPVPTLTEDEVRELFLQHVRNVVGYWTGVYDRGERTPAECISGCAFSILVMLDGGSADLPGWAVVPYPHEEDKAFLIAQGIKPYPELSNELHRQLVDIAGSLHELFHNPNVPVVRNPLHITKKDWQESRATKRWAFTVEVLLKEGEEFERVRKEGNPVAFLVDEYEVLTKRAEELGVHYVPLDYDTMSPDFSFKFATDDDQIFAKMIKTLDAYVIRGYF